MRDEASDSAGFAEGDLALHVAIAVASGNPFMRSMGGVIEAALRASFLLSAPVEEQERDTTILFHQQIVDAIVQQNPEAAMEAMRRVIFDGLRHHGGKP